MEKNKNIPAEGESITPEAPVAEPPAVDAPTPDLNTGSTAPQEQDGITPGDPGDVVVSSDKIEELMAERRAAARAAVEQAEPPAPEAGAPAMEQTGATLPEQTEDAAGEKPKEAVAEEQKAPRRGRPPKGEKVEQTPPKSEKSQDTAKPRKGRPPKADTLILAQLP